MPTVVTKMKNNYVKNQPKNEYEYRNLNKRVDLLISRVDALLNRL